MFYYNLTEAYGWKSDTLSRGRRWIVGFRYGYCHECVIEKQAFLGRLKGSWSFTALPNLRDPSISILGRSFLQRCVFLLGCFPRIRRFPLQKNEKVGFVSENVIIYNQFR